MSLDIDQAVHESFDRLWSRNGGVLVGAMLVVSIINTAVWQTLQAGALAQMSPGMQFITGGSAESSGTLSLPVSFTVAVGLFAATLPFRAAFRVVVVRVFGSKFTGRIPRKLVTTDLLVTALRDLVAVICVFVVVFAIPISVLVAGAVLRITLLIVLGFLLIALASLPGLVLLYFVRQEVAIGGRGVVGALKGSYELTADDRWNTLGLIFILTFIRMLLFIPAVVAAVGAGLLTATATAGATGASSGGGTLLPFGLGLFVGLVFGAIIKLFGIGATTRGYMELREAQS